MIGRLLVITFVALTPAVAAAHGEHGYGHEQRRPDVMHETT